MKKLFSFSLVAVLLIIFTGGGFVFYRLAKFRSAVSELKADRQPVSLLDLAVPIAIDAPNSSIHLRRLAAPLKSFEGEMFALGNEVLSKPVDDEMIGKFHEIEKAYPDVFPLIDNVIADFTIAIDVTGQFDEDVTGYLQDCRLLRSCARVMSWKMRILEAEGKPDEAVEVGLEILKLTRLYDAYPTLVAQLVRIACRGIAIQAIHELIIEHPVSEEVRVKLNVELALLDRVSDYRHSLVTERAVGIESVSEQNMFQLAMNGVGYLEYIASEIENADKEGFERDLSFEEDFSYVVDGVLTGGIIPALKQTRQAVDRLRSWVRALRIINGLTANPEKAKVVQDGVTKEALAALGIPGSMMVDTVTGELMKIKRKGDAWVVYSVGEDKLDDGGSHEMVKDYVLGGEEE